MNINNVKWASKHDWFISSRLIRATGTYAVTVRDFIPNDETGEYEDITIRFGMINELREWAGY